MHGQKIVARRLAASATLLIALGAALAFSGVNLGDAAQAGPATIILADAHTYRHCHNLPRRTYCHKSDALPMNWPPLSNTPHSGEERPKSDGPKELKSKPRDHGKG